MKYKLINTLLICIAITVGFVFSQNEGNQEEILVTIHATDTHLPTLLSILAEESGYNIVTGPNVNSNDKLTIHLEDVPVDQAINLVVRAAGLSYEMVGNSILVAKQEKLDEDVGVTPHVLELKYANAEEVSSLLANITTEITVDKSGNNLLVSASPKKLAEIEAIISEIDKPAIQIMLEARLIEVALSDEDKQGIDWSKLSRISTIFAESGASQTLEGGAESGSIIPGSTWEVAEDGTPYESSENPPYLQIPSGMPYQRLGDGGFAFSRQLTAYQLTLDFLMKNNRAEILTNSQVVTLNGHEAQIQMVDIVPYILSSGGVGGQVQVARENVGIKLHILPTVNTDGYITTKITPEVSSIYDFIGPERTIPWVKKRVSTTTIRVKDQESIIIAGLLSMDKKKTVHKFPLLWRIPWIGKKLFTHNIEIESKTDLIIQITPRIVKDDYTGIEKKSLHKVTEKSAFENKNENE